MTGLILLSISELDDIDTTKPANTIWDAVTSSMKRTALNVVGINQKQHKFHNNEIFSLSENQKALRLRIQNSKNPEDIRDLRKLSNLTLLNIKKIQKTLVYKETEEQLQNIVKQKDGTRMFMAMRLLMKKQRQNSITVWDTTGAIIINNKSKGDAISRFYYKMLNWEDESGYKPYPHTAGALSCPINTCEILDAIKKLKIGRSARPDNIPPELVKYAPVKLAEIIAYILNKGFEQNNQLDFGKGWLIPLQKPGKQKGPLLNLRPIIILTTLRKTLSLVALERIRIKVENYLSLGQSGFRTGRSTADVIWTHRWTAALCQKYKRCTEILGIDMSRAFDSIHRTKLVDVLSSFLNQDDVRIIIKLLQGTQLATELGKTESNYFYTSRAIPQGDLLSPVLFIVYLEAALRDFRPFVDNSKYNEIIYADDVNFVSEDAETFQYIIEILPHIFSKWFLKVNHNKTEYTKIVRAERTHDEPWRKH
ncbi:uncharacterized protein LOC115231674 [Octopus sinensis]|uniref:Uncharacterized protein LOC115231674 n=1 Tax=Octopus sinensis TaxID=2607531 RepID=A0A6P7U973_9MOLL|nr:uncharacterized protein LOC115231674 [Octopus sinensis]